MVGKWVTVEAKENRKPKGGGKRRAEAAAAEGEADPALDFYAKGVVPNSRAESLLGLDARSGSGANLFSPIEQAQQRVERERAEKREAQRKAAEQQAQRKAVERAAAERRRAAAERARRDADPTTWPTLAESLAENAAVISEVLEAAASDPMAQATASLRLHYVMGLLAQKTPRAVEWPVGDRDGFPGSALELPLGPALEDKKAAVVLREVLHQHTEREDVDGLAVVNCVISFFGPKGMKVVAGAAPGEGVAARAFVQLLLQRYRAGVTAHFGALLAVFADAASGRFHSKVSFVNFCWVAYQLAGLLPLPLRRCEGEKFQQQQRQEEEEEASAQHVLAAATCFLNATAATDWYASDAPTNIVALELIEELAAALDRIEEGDDDDGSSSNSSSGGHAGTAALPRLTAAAASGALKRCDALANNKAAAATADRAYGLLLRCACQRLTDAGPALFQGVLEALPASATQETSRFQLRFLADLLDRQPRLFVSRWLPRVADAPVGTALLIMELTSRGQAVDTAFAHQAAPRLRQLAGSKKANPALARQCTDAVAALGQSATRDLVAEAQAAADAAIAARRRAAAQQRAAKATPKNGRGAVSRLRDGEGLEEEEEGDVPLVLRVAAAVLLAALAVSPSLRTLTI